MLNGHKQLLESLERSHVFREFQAAFSAVTRLPLVLRPVEAWQLPFRGAHRENPFCELMGRAGRTCSMCLQSHQRHVQRAISGSLTFNCWCGFATSAVPVPLDGKVIGMLETGPVFRSRPSVAGFERSMRQVKVSESGPDAACFRDAYFATQQVSPSHYDSVISLVSIFASHLSLLAGQIAAQAAAGEPPVVRRALDFILEHHTESLRLTQVAQVAGVNSFHFCKVFKRATGLSFTQFLTKTRMEKAKTLLLNPDFKVSEIAYAVGFQSLTHFNRVFKRGTGLAPSTYRAKAIGWRGRSGGNNTSARKRMARSGEPLVRSLCNLGTAPSTTALPVVP